MLGAEATAARVPQLVAHALCGVPTTLCRQVRVVDDVKEPLDQITQAVREDRCVAEYVGGHVSADARIGVRCQGDELVDLVPKQSSADDRAIGGRPEVGIDLVAAQHALTVRGGGRGGRRPQRGVQATWRSAALLCGAGCGREELLKPVMAPAAWVFAESAASGRDLRTKSL